MQNTLTPKPSRHCANQAHEARFLLQAGWLAGWLMLAGWLTNDAPTFRNYYIEQFDVNPEAISLMPLWLQPHQSAGFDL